MPPSLSPFLSLFGKFSRVGSSRRNPDTASPRNCKGSATTILGKRVYLRAELTPILDLRNLNKYIQQIKFHKVSLASITESSRLVCSSSAGGLFPCDYSSQSQEISKSHGIILTLPAYCPPFWDVTSSHSIYHVHGYLCTIGIQVFPYLEGWLFWRCSR